MPGGASKFATHLPAPFFDPCNIVCASGQAHRVRQRAAVRQRYNTLDFASKIVCHETAGFFGFFRSKGNEIPSERPRQRKTPFPFAIPLPTRLLLAPIGNPEQQGLPFRKPLLSVWWLSIRKNKWKSYIRQRGWRKSCSGLAQGMLVPCPKADARPFEITENETLNRCILSNKTRLILCRKKGQNDEKDMKDGSAFLKVIPLHRLNVNNIIRMILRRIFAEIY